MAIHSRELDGEVVGVVAQGVEVEAQLGGDGILETGQREALTMAPAAAIEQIRARRCRATLARAQRWRWRDRVTGQPFGALFRRSIREDPAWAASHLHWHRALVERREVDSAVGSAISTAYGQLSPVEQGLDDLDFADLCVQRSRDRHAAEVEATKARRAGVSVAVLRVITGRR